jgi:hypothetical protein
MRRLRLLLGASLTATAAVVACTLNPQPLPPSDFSPGYASDDASAKDGGQFGVTPPTPADAGTAGNDREGGASDAAPSADASDAGDASDASDAAPDADGG